MDRRKATFAAAFTSVVLASPALAGSDPDTTESEWTLTDVFFAATSVASYVRTAANVVALLTAGHTDAAPAPSPAPDEATDLSALAAAVEADPVAANTQVPAPACEPVVEHEVTLRVPPEFRAELGQAAQARFIWVTSTPRVAARCTEKVTSHRETSARFAQLTRPSTPDRLVVYRIATNAVAQAGNTARCR